MLLVLRRCDKVYDPRMELRKFDMKWTSPYSRVCHMRITEHRTSHRVYVIDYIDTLLHICNRYFLALFLEPPSSPSTGSCFRFPSRRRGSSPPFMKSIKPASTITSHLQVLPVLRHSRQESINFSITQFWCIVYRIAAPEHYKHQ